MADDTLDDLHDALVDAYDDLPRARAIVKAAGIVSGTLPSGNLPMRNWWSEAIQTLQIQGTLLALLDAAIADPTVVALKPRFQALRDAIEQEQASISHLALSKPSPESAGLQPEDAARGFVAPGSAVQTQPRAPRALGGMRILGVVAAIVILSVAAFYIFTRMAGERSPGRAIAPASSPTLVAAASNPLVQPADTPSPAPSATLTATPTATPTSSPSPTPTATPTDLPLQILNYRDGDQVPYSTSLLGVYGAADQDKVIRVFVQPPPNADGSPARFYPQSSNHCNGNDGAAMVDGRWEQHVLVGMQDASEVGKPFSIFVTTVAKEDDAAVAAEIQSWCPGRETHWPGFQELPVADGGKVIRISVLRSGEPDQAPDPSRAELPGQVTITELQPGQAVGNEQVVGGTYADLRDGDAIWVLVHTTFGKWFPQSNPCIGRQVTSVNGRWHATSSFGGQTGEPYEVVVVVADPEADAFFEQRQQEWCTADERDPGFVWPGLTTIELPQGITEKDRIRVYQK